MSAVATCSVTGGRSQCWKLKFSSTTVCIRWGVHAHWRHLENKINRSVHRRRFGLSLSSLQQVVARLTPDAGGWVISVVVRGSCL